ncbi:DUF2690 domain-containing protein [Allostreptomyces psammosilenae]|uniref:DUF2690 domain-containing protein n=1 Tax=Allostreptomyces psammosilenae TaxID=1892865 RepID=A0A853A841_9ACTN|nr:DUF2690 domain-containing protein [Allostreptomyces psammosilenae]NYI06602.1 hypothetical protein [Allostreptomyces psammosilenae]
MRYRLAAVSAALVSLAGLGMAPSAVAAEAESSAAASCSGSACDGRNPVAEGCDAGSYVLDAGYAEADGVVELRYSPACGTTYARVLYSRPGAELYIGGNSKSFRVRVPEGSTSTVSPMLYGATTAFSGGAIALDW